MTTERSGTRWERVQDYLFTRQEGEGKLGVTSEFTAAEYADDQGLDTTEATADIQAHLGAQRRKGATTLFVLRRKEGTRTGKTIWLAGVRTIDAKRLGKALTDDVRVKVLRAFRPDLLRLAARNPRAAKHAEAQVEAVVDHALAIFELAATAGSTDED
jgi:hypothetical protein